MNDSFRVAHDFNFAGDCGGILCHERRQIGLRTGRRTRAALGVSTSGAHARFRYGRRPFSAWDHFLALAFAKMTFRGSLRDIEACLSTSRLAYRLGIRRRVTRSTLARANEERDWRLYSALAHKLMHRARQLHQDEPAVLDLEMPVYAVDLTLIDLSLRCARGPTGLAPKRP